MAANDIYLLQHFYANLGQVCMNTYYYRQETSGTTPGNSSQSVREAWMTLVLPAVRAVQQSQVGTFKVNTYNLFDLNDLDEFAVSPVQAGTQPGDAANPFLAWAFVSARKSRNVGAGQRRIGGLVEADVTAGQASGAALTRLGTAAAAFNAIIQDTVPSGQPTYRPVIVKRVRYITESGKVAYRLPESQAEANVIFADNWVYTRVTTQNSRKPGHGD